MDESYPMPLVKRIILAFLLGGLVVLSYVVLHLFLVPAAWATILAYVTWPAYRRLRSLMRGNANASALLMTVVLTAACVVPLIWLIVLLRGELVAAYQAVAVFLAHGPHQLPELIARIPWLGQWLQELLNQVSTDPAAFRAQVAEWAGQWTGEAGQLVGGVGRNATKLGFALLTLFFMYRDGESALDQVRRVLRHFLGNRLDAYLASIGGTTKAVVYGLVLTALAQGALAGLGYWVAGMEAPVLLAAFTVLIALIPFGTPFVWGAIGVWLLVTGKTIAGVGLLLWGALVVSWVDNLIRPLVISSATQIPFLLVVFGVLGGLAAFGLVGLFMGPVILAVLMAVWHEWLEEQASANAGPRVQSNGNP
ncbi:AI-2E family transporter [Paraburkholderia sp. DD10]|jgi:predicted PurR-regulated permease PerM|uniref:PurR-regulated permease PerM n=1 Tax=Paraburkholderia terricola TaxID=169427 RepID=A0ABU1LL73_9BURK|nr:AI-2E family transporter [Paraburkholderia terricola]MDR6407280.1 putative PurR-regulated permease PerM [Paraburkholderia terricola]MDR6479042.1 putative PurR-regulated permease PerM [Paraburkholderia terricola]